MMARSHRPSIGFWAAACATKKQTARMEAVMCMILFFILFLIELRIKEKSTHRQSRSSNFNAGVRRFQTVRRLNASPSGDVPLATVRPRFAKPLRDGAAGRDGGE